MKLDGVEATCGAGRTQAHAGESCRRQPGQLRHGCLLGGVLQQLLQNQHVGQLRVGARQRLQGEQLLEAEARQRLQHLGSCRRVPRLLRSTCAEIQSTRQCLQALVKRCMTLQAFGVI